MKMDWVHCNRCFWQPGENSNRRIMLTNCGHLFCTVCENLGKIKNCLICHSESISTLVAANMPNNIEQYFFQPEKVIKKQVDALEFQSSHRQRLFKHLTEKCIAFEAEINKQKEEIRRHREEKNKLKDELKSTIEEMNRHREEKNQLKSKLGGKENALWSAANHNASRSSVNSQFHLSPIANDNQSSQYFNRLKSFGQQQLSNMQNNASLPKKFFFNVPNDSSSPMTNNDTAVFTPPSNSFKNAYRDNNGKSPTTLSKSSPLLSPPSPVVPRTAMQRKVSLPGDKPSISPINKLLLQRLNLKSSTPSYGRTTPSHVKVAGRLPRTTPAPLHSVSKFNKFF